MLYALRGEVTPHLGSFFDALYFAGASVLTLGFGEIVASGGLSRIVVIVAAATGLGVVALVITFIFSLFANYQRREVLVVTLSARAKAPPSAVTLLETHARLDMVDELPGLFREWERWAAEVLDSHVAYPLLGYFRSSHDSISWISALGAVLDSAALVVTTIQGVPRGQAHMMLKVGAHLVEDISNVRGQIGEASEVDEAGFAIVLRAPRPGRLQARATRAGPARLRARTADLRGPARSAGRLLGHPGATLERPSRCAAGLGHPRSASREVAGDVPAAGPRSPRFSAGFRPCLRPGPRGLGRRAGPRTGPMDPTPARR